MKKLLLALLFCFGLSSREMSAAELRESSILKTEANVPVEISFTAQKEHRDPFNTIEFNVLFIDDTGAEKLVPAFWDDGNIWKVRYASPVLGLHRWKTQCNDVSDSGLNGIEGKIEISKYLGTNPLFKHGQLEITGDKRHLQHADGTPFFWLGDTWWMGLCHRIHFPDEFKQLAADRKQKGFNVIQIVAGLYPDMFPFDPRGANEAGFPWTTNYTSIRPEYFDAADKRIRYLIDEGFTPCIVGAWGYFLPMMGEARAKQHWRELIARYGAWPVVWCVAGEANLPWYRAKNFPYDDREQVKGWTEIARYIRATDPFHRLTTIHPTGIGKLNARGAIDDASLIDFDMLQTPHGEANAVAPTLAAMNHAYQLPPAMPVINGEAAYENLNGGIPAEWPRAMFWLCMMNGAAGHTYGANGIWQCNREGQPHGPSPTAGSPPTGYGTIPWNEAMHLPGSQQIGDAKKFLEKFPWQRCVPVPETVRWETDVSRPQWSHWIWYPEGDPRVDAPVESRYFRREFNVEKGPKIKRATLHIVADDQAVIWLNGKKIREVSGSGTVHALDLTALLQSGKNILALEARNLPAPVKLNPAGLLIALEITSKTEGSVTADDENWRSAKHAAEGWQKLNFDDADWIPAKIVAKYGDAPWGKVTDGHREFVPFAMGIKDELRILYAISPRPIVVTQLRPDARYELTEFDPVTGESQTQMARADATGQLRRAASTHNHDWAIALKLKEGR
jgi:hypothetical protein